jgi:nucleoid DNA-binding protein
MSDAIAGLTPEVRAHIEAITRSSGLPETGDSLLKMATAWLEKKRLFEQQAASLDMKPVNLFAVEEPGGALALTWSGSLVSLEPIVDGGRRVEYASIPLRADVPALAIADRTALEVDLRVDGEAWFSRGPVKSTSRVLAIAACSPGLPAAEQSRRIREATIFLTNGFVRINRSLLPTESGTPDQFTLRGIVAYLAKRSGLKQTQVQDLVRDYLSVVEAGILLGERVQLGGLGRLSSVRRAARKARAAVNPSTGEPITIPARPERLAPRMSFSRALKARLEALPPE